MNWKTYRQQFEIYMEENPKTGKKKRQMRYIGQYYRFTASAEKIKATKKWMWLCAVMFWIGFIGAGFMNPPGAFVWWVLPFYIFSILPGFFALTATFRLGRVKDKITSIEKAECVVSINRSAWGITILSALAAIGSAVMLIMGWTLDKAMEEAIFMCLSLLRMIAGLGMLYWKKNLTVEEV